MENILEMTQANELRIGNWLRFTAPNGKQQYLQVNIYHLCDIVGDIRVGGVVVSADYYRDCYSPIPLTPEILEKAGFSILKKDSDYVQWFRKKLWNFYIERVRDRWVLKTKDYAFIGYIDYVHIFQNFYYLLNQGEELNIEL